MVSEISTREAYGRTLVELGRENPNIVVLDADLSKSTMTQYFAKEFPDRFFNCGIAEQNMMGIAAGLAASGKTVFASTFAVFAACRCFDQVRMSIAQPHLNVKIAASHGGITVGEDGFSHHSIEDLSLYCSLPGFTVLVPSDGLEAEQAVQAAAANYGPFYIRLGRPKVPPVNTETYQFQLGKGVVLRQGNDASIIAIGVMVAAALKAASNLALEGIDCRVINMPTLKPVDEETIIKAAVATKAIVTAEEHLEGGALSGTVARVVAQSCPVPMAFVGIKNTYAKSGKPNELLKEYGLTAADIERAVRSLVNQRG